MRLIFKTILFLILIFSFFGCTIYYVQQSPPPLKIEIKGPPPRAGMVWIAGYWAWKKDRYVWVPGHWAKPPRKGAIWVPGYWKKTPRGHKWVPGHWK